MIAKCLGLKAGSIIETHIFRNFNFDTGKSSLQSGTERQLEEIAAALRQIKPSLIKIHGHTDMQRFYGKSQRESDLLNWKLSEKLAETIAQSNHLLQSQRIKDKPARLLDIIQDFTQQ
ncbi:hypothetical protein PN36_28195 [Candidatus Thiomargarita nelsonii]|uniref:OmpA-like domain-containing protein n=1 Tax=Candidatus Thiomargarita nelsonii TaxID=1003181 RepID=A0A0A6PEV5_9GAMM|nr:hypothetical protein PN36_28195 [Candidatus Thiomargarita nelsonii]